jgi:hypothetical protein
MTLLRSRIWDGDGPEQDGYLGKDILQTSMRELLPDE